MQNFLHRNGCSFLFFQYSFLLFEMFDHGWLDTVVVVHCCFVLLGKMKLFTTMKVLS